MIEPGVYNTVDPGGLEKLQRQHEQDIDQNKSKARIWIKHKEEYKTLKTKVRTRYDLSFDIFHKFLSVSFL